MGHLTNFSQWLEARRAPDYSFDRWVAGAEQLKSDLGSMVGKSRAEEDKLDKEVDKKKKEVKDKETEKAKEPKPEPETKKPEDDEHEKLWNRLKTTAEKMSKERKTHGGVDEKGSRGAKDKSSS